MMDRFGEIKSLYELGEWPSSPNKAFTLSEWLIDEVERLRKIEDAARQIDFDTSSNMGKLDRALEFNPRPDNADG